MRARLVVVTLLKPGASLVLLVEEDREGSGFLRPYVVGVGDVDPGEQGLVEQAPDSVGCLLVHRVTVGEKVEAVGEFGLRGGVVRVRVIESSADVVELPGDALLLGLELVERDRPGVVSLHELVALVAQVPLLPREVFGFVLGLGVDDRELLADRGLERAERGGAELDAGIVVDDELFDPGDVHGLAPAVGDLGAPPGADEVGVDDAVLVLGVGQQQP